MTPEELQEVFDKALEEEEYKPTGGTRPFQSRYSITLSYLSILSGGSSQFRSDTVSEENGETTRSMIEKESHWERRRNKRLAVRNLTALHRTLIALSFDAPDSYSSAEQNVEVAEIRRALEGVSLRTARNKGILSANVPPRGTRSENGVTSRNCDGPRNVTNDMHEGDADTEDSNEVSLRQEREPLLLWLNRCLACEPRDSRSLHLYQSYQPWLAFVPSLLFVAVMLTAAALFVTMIR